MNPACHRTFRLPIVLAVLAILGVYVALLDLKCITTDEGMRLAIINGGARFGPDGIPATATWARVLEANAPNAYQPGYFLLLNTLMRLAGTQAAWFFRSVNVAGLGLCLAGLLALSQGWRDRDRLFLLVTFSLNAFLLMHVLQIREYVFGLAFYVWSTWLVLRLDRREFSDPMRDTAWYSGYGLLLLLGFFTQSWVVFPAIAQGAFLIIRTRPTERLRHYAHLTLSYLIVLSVAWPYLQTHRQKVDVGRWATEADSLVSHLSQGFHLVLAGHLAGRSPLSDALFWCWLAVLLGGTALLLRRPASPADPGREDERRQAALMLGCSAAALAFQVGYAYLVENLSLWPRYFIIHYFFLMWLLAMNYRRLGMAGASGRRAAVLGRWLLTAAAAISAAFQIWSFQRDPWLDTSQNADSNWRATTAQLAPLLRPDDVLLSQDYISRSTLTYTLPLRQRVLLYAELPTADLQGVHRLVLLEPLAARGSRPALVETARARGFTAIEETAVLARDGRIELSDWRIIRFLRP
jgi:hypothetical protein